MTLTLLQRRTLPARPGSGRKHLFIAPLYGRSRVARIDHDCRRVDKLLPIDTGVISNDQDGVVLGGIGKRYGFHAGKIRMLARARNNWNEWIMIIDSRHPVFKKVQDHEPWTFARVVDVLLVGDAHHQNLCVGQTDTVLDVERMQHGRPRIGAYSS